MGSYAGRPGTYFLRVLNLRSLTPKSAVLVAVLSLQVANGRAPGQSATIHPEAPRVVSSFTTKPEADYPFRENMYRALQLPDGRIVALSIARVARQQTMQGRFSSDNGESWSPPQDLFDWPQEAGGFGLFDALVDKDGEIHIFILCDGNSGILYPNEQEGTPIRPGEILDIWHVRSHDGRTRWQTPKAIWTGHGSDLLSVIQLRNGRLVLPFSSTHGRSWSKRGGGFLDFTYVGTYGISTLYSDDDGDTWQTSSEELTVQTPDLGTYGADEPVVLQLKDGRVWMLMRTQRGRFYESFSPDGARWSPAQPTALVSSDSPAALLRLRDGTILLFSNACLRYPYAYGARNVLHVAISQDEGRTWRGFREVARDPLRNSPPSSRADYGLSYSFPTLTNDGHVLFSNWVQSGRERTFRLLDPAWVYETRQSTDFSGGIEDWSTFGSKGVELESDPQKSEARVLAIRKADKDWPAGAVWNFPVGSKGRLKMQILLRPGFGGTLIGFTDHFSVPWDLEDKFYNVFNLPIAADGAVLPNFKLAPGRWYEVEFDWDTNQRQCRVSADGRQVGVILDNQRSIGVNYVRLRSIATEPDAGLLVRAVDADVSASWKPLLKDASDPAKH